MKEELLRKVFLGSLWSVLGVLCLSFIGGLITLFVCPSLAGIFMVVSFLSWVLFFFLMALGVSGRV